MAQSALTTQRNVIYALTLRDMQTRFGGSHASYLVALGWPLAHIALLLVIYGVTGRSALVGTSTTMFFATGIVPFMLFHYPSRFMMQSLLSNQPLLAFPVVKPLDIMLARALLESIAGFAVICITAFVLFALGNDIAPRDPATALSALGAMLLLAIGVGLFNAVIIGLASYWVFVYILFSIVVYLTSGILFISSALPDPILKIVSWNPALHGVEWFRSAYYADYGAHEIPDKHYLLMFGLISLFIALIAERFILPKLTRR